jgi:capsular polysaccharide export protein
MMERGLESYAGKRVLLLQGPVGPFFARLAADLRAAGADVLKINFNAGDWLFYPRRAVNYRGSMEAWPAWLEAQLRRQHVDAIFLFGDCRPVHEAARVVATSLGIPVGVFEEGYVRPDYVTLEPFGVNGHSRLPRDPAAYTEELPVPAVRYPVGNAYWWMVHWGFWYFTVGALGKVLFPQYVHHRPLKIGEAWPWVRSVWRKQWYRWKEKGLQEQLTGPFSRRFYLAPLQVFNDAQVTVHAEVEGVEGFIRETLESFAAHAPADTVLVFKHHPMDRGYRDYSRLIHAVARAAGVPGRVLYIHDQHLPSLLDHARGVVVVNSTVGLSALHHGAPTIVCGHALYDMPGLTYQGELSQFWREASACPPDPALYRRFRTHLLAHTQVNGSFYRPLALPGLRAGLWFGGAVAPLEGPREEPRDDWAAAHNLHVGDTPPVSG